MKSDPTFAETDRKHSAGLGAALSI